MKKLITLGLLAMTLATSTARADDDAAWAIGGFILGVIASNNGHSHDQELYRQHREPPTPVYTSTKVQEPVYTPPPRMIPVYDNVCEWTDAYDRYGRPLPAVQVCRQVIVGYRQVTVY